ncbi:MAG: alpha/beta hydrolase [Gammaproteobacteria bacterium]|nr:alpha/beta hydrolase [Gammaproteobacteria bacterium]
MRHFVYLIGISGACFYLVFGILLVVMQRSFIYFPSEPIRHGYEERVFENEGESLKVITLNKGADNAILYFGGNAEAVALNAADFEQHFPNASIYLVNYRGYGGSSGKPTEAALCSDALHVYDQIIADHKRVVVIGRSLGSGVASYLAYERPIEKLVLVTPFDSIESVAQKNYPVYPVPLLIIDSFKSVDLVSDIRAEVLIMIAGRDAVVERWHTDNLLAAFTKRPPKVEVIKNAGHNNISAFERYYPALKAFLAL